MPICAGSLDAGGGTLKGSALKNPAKGAAFGIRSRVLTLENPIYCEAKLHSGRKFSYSLFINTAPEVILSDLRGV